MIEKAVLTETELSDLLGLSPWTIRRWRLNEGLPHIQIGNRFLYRQEAVFAWLESKETRSAASDDSDEVGVIRRIKP